MKVRVLGGQYHVIEGMIIGSDQSLFLAKYKTWSINHLFTPRCSLLSVFTMVKAVVLGAAGQFSPSSNMARNLISALRWYWSTFGLAAQDKPLGYRGLMVPPMTWRYSPTETLASSSLVSMISSTLQA
jgi:hypothetical protein